MSYPAATAPAPPPPPPPPPYSYPAAAAPAPPPSPPSAAVNNAAATAPDPERWANEVEWAQNGKGNQWPTMYLTSDGLYYVRDNEGKHRSKNLRYVHERNPTIVFSDKEFFNHYPGRRPSGGRRSTRKDRTRRRSTRKNRGRQMKKNRKITYKN